MSPPSIRAVTAAVKRLRIAGCGNRPDATDAEIAETWRSRLAGLSDEDVAAVAQRHLDGEHGQWWPKEADIRDLAADIRRARAVDRTDYPGCHSCGPRPGWRSLSVRYRDTRGVEHVVCRDAQCDCAAGLALVQAAEAWDGKGEKPTRRMTWGAVVEHWRRTAEQQRFTIVGIWHTPIHTPGNRSAVSYDLPVEARYTTETLAAMEARRRPDAGPARAKALQRVREADRDDLRAERARVQERLDPREQWHGPGDDYEEAYR